MSFPLDLDGFEASCVDVGQGHCSWASAPPGCESGFPGLPFHGRCAVPSCMDPQGLARGSPPGLHHAGWQRMGAEPGGIGASSQPQASPPVFSCSQLAVELHPGKSCHGPGASTTVQRQPGQPRVSGDTGRQVLGSVFLLGPAQGLCPHAAPGEVALPAASSMRSSPSCVPIACPWLGML